MQNVSQLKSAFPVRVAVDLILAIAVIHGWWFVALPVAIIGALNFNYFIEPIVAGVAYDALFGMIPGMGWTGYIGTIISLVVVCIVNIFKKQLRN